MNNSITKYVWMLGLFLSSFWFFSEITPLLPYDGDDWIYLARDRLAIPLWGNWNPTKVLPEILMQLNGFISLRIIFPFDNDVINSIKISSSFLIASFILLLIYTLYRYLIEVFKLEQIEAISLSSLFYLFCFVLFDHHTNFIIQLFWGKDLNCVFNYLAPGLLNFSLVLYLLVLDSKKTRTKNYFLFAIWIYLSMFSNLFQNIILASFALSILVFRIAKSDRIINYLKNNKLYISILLIFLLCLLFEANGARAKTINKSISIANIILSLKYGWGGVIRHYNTAIFFIFVTSFTMSFFVRCKNKILKKIYKEMQFVTLFSCFISFLYLMLLCARVGPTYFARIDILNTLIFWILLIFINALAFLIRNFLFLKFLVFFSLFYYIFKFISPSVPYKFSTKFEINPIVVREINLNIINNILFADMLGLKEVSINVPKSNIPNNWLHDNKMAMGLSELFFKYGLVSRKLIIHFVPDNSINIKYSLSDYDKIYK